MGIHGCEKNGTIVQCLLQYWKKALDEVKRTENCLHLQSVFAEGEGAIDVRDEWFGKIITATSFEDLDRLWREAKEDAHIERMELVGDASVEVVDEKAIINFELVGYGVDGDGNPFSPPPHWRGEHEWRQFDGEWRIIRERLTQVK